MEQLLLLVKYRFMVNFASAKSENLVWNIFAGIFLCVLVSFFLWKDSEGEDSFYKFRKIEILYISFWLIPGTVFIFPLFPLRQGGVSGALSLFLCVFVLAVTSVTDEKSGMFRLEYLLLGLAGEGFLFLYKLFGNGGTNAYGDFVLMVACAGITLVCGVFCYSPGDAGLILMALLVFINVLDGRIFLFAFLVMLCVAMGTYVVRYVRHFRDMLKNPSKKSPFTLHIMIGTVVAMFLLY